MATNSTKSARFKSLLPIIYTKLIVSGSTHAEVSEWLNTEHGLEFKGRTFSNYLSKYGDIKTAKESFDEEARKKSVASSWASSVNSESSSQASSQSINAALDKEYESSTAKVEKQAVVEPTKPKRSFRISDQLGINNNPNPKNIVSADSLLDGYEESNAL